MSKILTNEEMVEIIKMSLKNIPDSDQEWLADDLGTIIQKYIGGEMVCTSPPGADLGACAHFHRDERIPEDEGPFQYFDNDEPWEN